jgi:hypothetical protein
MRTQTGLPAGTSEIEPGGRDVPRHSVIPQVQCVRRPGKQDEHVVGQGGVVEFRGGRRTEARGLQADPPQLVARHGWLVREDPAPVQGPDRVAALRLFFSPHRHLPDASGRGHRRIVLRSAGPPPAVEPFWPRAGLSPPGEDAWGSGHEIPVLPAGHGGFATH